MNAVVGHPARMGPAFALAPRVVGLNPPRIAAKRQGEAAVLGRVVVAAVHEALFHPEKGVNIGVKFPSAAPGLVLRESHFYSPTTA